MTPEEFSNNFTILLNSYNTQAAFGDNTSKNEIVLNEFEKSVLLTQAQDIITRSYIEDSQSIDSSSKKQIDFSNLIKVKELDANTDSSIITFDDRGIMFKLPKREKDDEELDNTCDVLYILGESITYTEDSTSKTFIVVPLHHREYSRLMSKAYVEPLKRQAWRLFQNNSSGYDVDSELILNETYSSKVKANTASLTYKIRYYRRPQPIVLEDLDDTNLSVEGYNTVTPCELNPSIHMEILNKAVELALATRGHISDNNK